jgi:Gnt-I system low-affinity gluconate transporter
MLAGFLVAIPVFFVFAFILLIPLVFALQRESAKSVLLYAIPLLAGLAITHAFIPPTPGPVAVADILGADLGWVILSGFLTGLPTALVCGLWFGRYIAGKMYVEAPEETEEPETLSEFPDWRIVILIIAVPLFLILGNTVASNAFPEENTPAWVTGIQLVGHPFSALIVANLIAWYFLGIRRKDDKETLFRVMTRSMAPAGAVILVTGAGGVFKQILIDTGAGSMMAESMAQMGFPLLLFAFLVAGLVRVLQGSATVAMITSASLVSPLLAGQDLGGFELALIVTAVAAGASLLSHVNDSGFWLVSQYLELSERQTFRSWTVMTVLLGLTGFAMTGLLWVFFL